MQAHLPSVTAAPDTPTTLPAGKRERKKRALHERLYAASLAAFERDGYERVAVEAICTEVGIAKGTFFNHFPNKAAVLAAWYARNVAASLGSTAHPGIDPWLAPLLTLIEQMRQHPRLWHAKNALAANDPALASAEVNGDQALRDHYTRLIEQSMPANPDLPLNAASQAELLVAQITGTCREWSIEQAAKPDRVEADVDTLLTRLRERVGALRQLLGMGGGAERSFCGVEA